MKSVVLLISFLLAFWCSCTSASPNPVLQVVGDINGEILRSDTRYFVVSVIRGAGGGGVLRVSLPGGAVPARNEQRKKENESDSYVWVEERAERTFNEFHQYVAENLDSSIDMTPELSTQNWKEKVIAAMSAQIAQLTSTLAESERRRVAEQQNMSETVQQIKEQVMNLARRPTTSAPEDVDDSSNEDDYVDLTPYFRKSDGQCGFVRRFFGKNISRKATDRVL
ncbi:hypothetical protein MTR67_014489 [Solanum verrucosum]|uniref:Uncharacterized protein n=1 Tax=Solanum verrucosum TaxID=315347 RepID=A0AAF0QCB2_SOLVR|nr:hypothetical protein MTR67_014489 [Solanum verrucosum]